MSNFLAGAGGVLLKCWPLLVAAVPSIIVALTKAPASNSLADWLKYFLQFVSILTHKDEPGTLKLPLTAKRPPPRPTPSVPPPLLPLVLMLWAGLFAGSTSCAVWGGIFGNAADAVVVCTSEVLMTNADLLPLIRSILKSPMTDWKERLDAIKVMGRGTLACLLEHLAQDLFANRAPASVERQKTPNGKEIEIRTLSDHDAGERARQYINSKKLTVKY